MEILTFAIGHLVFGIPIQNVERVEEIAELQNAPNLPPYIPGYINVRGQLIPVLDTRMFFNVENKNIELTDKLIIVNAHTFFVALWVDSVNDLIQLEEKNFIDADHLNYLDRKIEGVVKTKEGLILLSKPEHFLNKEELEKLHNTILKSGV